LVQNQESKTDEENMVVDTVRDTAQIRQYVQGRLYWLFNLIPTAMFGKSRGIYFSPWMKGVLASGLTFHKCRQLRRWDQ
jgi:hypothetical protein